MCKHWGYYFHGHCVEEECEEKSYEGEKSLCVKHCKISTHRHCVKEGCGENSHDRNYWKNQTKWFFFIFKLKKMKGICSACGHGEPHEGSKDYCTKHCQLKGHGHCVDLLCDETPHGDISVCKKHCVKFFHGHCSASNCGKDVHYGGMGECAKHCVFSVHGHVKWMSAKKKFYREENIA